MFDFSGILRPPAASDPQTRAESEGESHAAGHQTGSGLAHHRQRPTEETSLHQSYVSIRSCKVLKAWDQWLEIFIWFEIWRTSWHYCFWGACRISKLYEHINTRSHIFKTLRDLTIRCPSIHPAMWCMSLCDIDSVPSLHQSMYFNVQWNLPITWFIIKHYTVKSLI